VNLSALLAKLPAADEIRRIIENLQESEPRLPQAPLALLGSAKPAFLALLQQQTRLPILVITARADQARIISEQLRAFSAEPMSIMRLPDPDALPYERVPWGVETIRNRLSALYLLASADPLKAEQAPVIVASARGLMQKTLPPAEILRGSAALSTGQQISQSELMQRWLELGYHSEETVDAPGQISRRGGIMDIFSPNAQQPVRIEFFGDEIESLRFFDPVSQRSEGRLKSFAFIPAGEALPTHSRQAAEALKSLNLDSCHPMAEMVLREEINYLEAGVAFKGIENYFAFMNAQPASLLDYLPAEGLLVLDAPQELAEVSQELESQAEELYKDMRERNELPPDWLPAYFGWAALQEQFRNRKWLNLGSAGWSGNEDRGELAGIFKPAPLFGGQVRQAIDEIVHRRSQGESVIVVSRQTSRLGHLLLEKNIVASPEEDLSELLPGGGVHLVQGVLREGWELYAQGGAVPVATLLTDTEIFGVRKPQMRRRQPPRQGAAPESFFSDLKPGDVVVHIEHGIGFYRGLVKRDFEGVSREYLEISYAANDKLYVPIHQADRLSRYVGMEEKPPTLNRLGTADWATVKRRAKKAIEDIAKELLEIYARREVVPGRSFKPDVPWQEELEASFPYPETDDQLRAIAAVKKDMQKARPMDRLICGDVGYGKTEVALRAAFKAVMDDTQVAMLVPTTVLAQQHYETFRRRLAPFPVEVEMLSRFRSRNEQKNIIHSLRQGTTDIIIGTHRLLQKDVQFKDLGLLVIDEEQRFGVKHKEMLKRMRAEVDVLTLTATPIPRTLHMSLTGVRDMSTIDTPPSERLAIQTTIAETDDALIRTAILREMDRGGQIYFVHNRVQGIEQITQKVHKLVPEAMVAYAHGQMPERRLEKVMREFSTGEYNVLVCTSIIESGIDIPNANTIIINRADTFGLAQLYQLRGRVGRSTTRAYAYLLIPRHASLSEVAKKRLEAIAEASELGAGFRIAMQDLEIRGAGELLGQKQHGHIAAIGFDLYCRLLAQAVRELKGEVPEGMMQEGMQAYLSPLAEGIQISLPLPAFLPEEYVSEESLRLRIYRRMAAMQQEEELDNLAGELQDRFGPLPEKVINLLYQLKVKILAMAAQVQAIGVEAGQIYIRAESLENIDRQSLQKRLDPAVRVNRRQLWLPLHPEANIWEQELEKILRTMGRMLLDPAA
jgi:transcription-repair coupling factor (superfamily II helicase)